MATNHVLESSPNSRPQYVGCNVMSHTYDPVSQIVVETLGRPVHRNATGQQRPALSIQILCQCGDGRHLLPPMIHLAYELYPTFHCASCVEVSPFARPRIEFCLLVVRSVVYRTRALGEQ